MRSTTSWTPATRRPSPPSRCNVWEKWWWIGFRLDKQNHTTLWRTTAQDCAKTGPCCDEMTSFDFDFWLLIFFSFPPLFYLQMHFYATFAIAYNRVEIIGEPGISRILLSRAATFVPVILCAYNTWYSAQCLLTYSTVYTCIRYERYCKAMQHLNAPASLSRVRVAKRRPHLLDHLAIRVYSRSLTLYLFRFRVSRVQDFLCLQCFVIGLVARGVIRRISEVFGKRVPEI